MHYNFIKQTKAHSKQSNKKYKTFPKYFFFAKSHDDLRLRHRGPDGLVREDLAPVDVQLVLDRDVLAQHGHVLHADLGGTETQISEFTIVGNRGVAHC